MGTDRTEAAKRGHLHEKKGKQHPIAAIEKRVIDSSTYSDTAFSSRAVLTLLCRNLEKDRNGHIQLSEGQAAANGIERKTLRRAFRDLIAHQIIVMTWRGGKTQGNCNKYALTWLPIKEREGINITHFKLHSWRDWQPPLTKKAGCQKCPQDSAKNVSLTAISAPKISPTSGDKMGPIEVMPVQAGYGQWVHDYLAGLAKHGPQFVAACPVAFIPGEVNHAP